MCTFADIIRFMSSARRCSPHKEAVMIGTVAIFGATGGVGLALVRQALADGKRVLVRSREKLVAALGAVDGLEIVEGELADEARVRATVRGAGGVLVALGAPASSRSVVRSEGTAAIVRAMRAEGVDRIVAVSVYGLGETRAELPFFLRYLVFPLILARAVADHERQERVLAESGLRWTAVRPPNLVDGGEEAVVHGVGRVAGISMQVSRTSVARFMLDVLESGAYERETPAISRRAA
jgi:uncharacterized protein YbjT (DUF2867 family)